MNQKRWIGLLLACVCLLSAMPMARAEVPGEPLEAFYCNDYTDILSRKEIRKMVDQGRLLEAERGVRLVAVMVPSLDGMDIEAYAQGLSDQWGLAGDDGRFVLLLLAVGDREVWISKGSGVKDDLPEKTLGVLLDTYGLPYFRGDDFAGGMIQVYRALAEALTAANLDVKPPSASVPKGKQAAADQAIVIGLMAVPPTLPEPGEPMTFQVTTTEETDRIEILDGDMRRLASGGADDYGASQYGRVWNLRHIFTAPYQGVVYVRPGNAAGWNEDGAASIQVSVGKPITAPAANPGALVDIKTKIFTNMGKMIHGAFERAEPIDLGGTEDYAGVNSMNGVLTFRGSGMRQNAAFGYAEPTAMKLERLWTSDVGLPSDGAHAFGSQPIIAQWHKQIREMMEMDADKMAKPSLREVLFAGNDGVLYGFDLDDGVATRDAQEVIPTQPMLGTPSVYPRGYPMLAVGIGDPARERYSEDTGTVLQNMLRNSGIGILMMKPNGELSCRSVITSPLIDNSSDTLLTIGGDGLLYTMKIGTELDATSGAMLIRAEYVHTLQLGRQDGEHPVDASMAAYGGHAYIATDNGLLLRVDLNTLTVDWAQAVGADTDAAPALDAYGQRLYHATRADAGGLAHIRSIDTQTGGTFWDIAVPGDIAAAPLVGTGPLDGWLYIAVDTDAGLGKLYCLNADTGETAWARRISGKRMASPLAIYGADGQAWIIQGGGQGLTLLDADGRVLDLVSLDAPVYGSPAAFDDMIAVATQDGKLHGVRLR